MQAFSTVGSPQISIPLYHFGMEWWRRAQQIRNAMPKGERPTYADIAAAADVTIGAVGHWFTGKRPPTVRELQTIAQELRVDVSNFFVTEDVYCVRDPHLIAAVKMLERMEAPQRRPRIIPRTSPTKSPRKRRLSGKS